MELLIIALVVTGWMTKAVQDGRTDRAYAKKGQVSPRHQVRLARLEKAGRPASPKGRGPLRNLAAEYWADAMLDLADRHRAKRAHRGPVGYDPDRPSVAQRFDTAVLDGIRRVQASRGWDMTKAAAKTAGRRFVGPVGEKPEPAPVEEGHQPECGWCQDSGIVNGLPCSECQPQPLRYYDQPEEAAMRKPARYDGGWDALTPEQQDAELDRARATQAKLARVRAEMEAYEEAARRAPTSEPTSTPTPTTGGTAMSEASNFETAVPALGELAAACQNLSDHVAGAESAADTFQSHVEEIDAAKQDVTAAIGSVQEQLAAKGVSGAAMDSITAAMEQVQAGDLMSAIDLIGQAKAQISDAKVAATEAAGAAGQAQQDLVADLGDANEAVESKLSGDPSFLGAGAR